MKKSLENGPTESKKGVKAFKRKLSSAILTDEDAVSSVFQLVSSLS